MLECGARDADIDLLRLRALELRLGGDHVGLGGDPHLVLVLGDLQRALVGVDRLVEQLPLLVRHAQPDEVGRQHPLQRQPRRGEVGLARLRAGNVAFDSAADLAPDVEVPRGGARQTEFVDGVRGGHGEEPAAAGRGDRSGLAARPARARAGGVHADGGEQSRARLADHGHRLAPARLGLLERLVGDVDLLLEPIERGIVVDRPPGAAAGRLARLGRLPAVGLLEALRHGCRRAVIVRADGAGGECERDQSGRRQRCAQAGAR